MSKITAKRIFTSTEVLHNKSIEYSEGKIVAITDCSESPQYDNIAPPLFDTHINGGERFYFTQENTELAIQDIYDASRATGTHYVLPCLITSSLNNIIGGIEAMKKYMAKNPNSGVLGMHLEGPFLNPNKRGAHLAKYIKKPNDHDIAQILEKGKDIIKIWTLAPELFSDSQIKTIQDSGVIIAAGHSNATYKEAEHAFDQNINLVTHLYNAMSGLHHRKPGLVGASLAHEVWAPIIVDGIHCNYGAVKIAHKAKPDKLFLISDALFLGRKKTSFQWEEFNAKLVNGEYKNSEGNLAGGAISLGEAIHNAVNEAEIPLQTAIEMATIRPAKALNLDTIIGRITKGYPAIFTTFNNKIEEFKVIEF